MIKDSPKFGTNILIYNPETIGYAKANVTGFDYNYDEFYGNIYISISNFAEAQNIELDPTTMKRIAIYNKEIECKKLDTEIKKKKEKIRELDNKLKDKEQRWKMIKDFVSHIYEIDIDDYEEDD